MLTRRSLFGLALLPVAPVPAQPATVDGAEIRRRMKEIMRHEFMPLGQWLVDVDFEMTDAELREIEYSAPPA